MKGVFEAVLVDFGIAREFTPDITQTQTEFCSSGFAPIEQTGAQNAVLTLMFIL